MPHDISQTSVRGVFRGTFDLPGRPWCDCLTVPDFQRPFCWTVDDLRRLLDDVDDLMLIPDSDPPRYADALHYLGAVAFLERDERKAGGMHHCEVLDGQQRLTSLALLAHILEERGSHSKVEAAKTLAQRLFSYAVLGDPSCRRTMLRFENPASHRHIRKIHRALDEEYKTLARLPDGGALYEATLRRDLTRFEYLAEHGRFAVRMIGSLDEAEQYFEGENNRGMEMTLLEMLVARHLRFVRGRAALASVQDFRSTFSAGPEELPFAQEAQGAPEGAAVDDPEVDQKPSARRELIEEIVLPAMLLPTVHGKDLWDAWDPKKAAELLERLKGVEIDDEAGGDDPPLELAPRRPLMDAVRSGVAFFAAMRRLLTIAEAVEHFLEEQPLPQEARKCLDDAFLRLPTRIALIVWYDRFLPTAVLRRGAEAAADHLLKSGDFKAHALVFLRFFSALNASYESLFTSRVLKLLRHGNPSESLLLLPCRSASPAACRRALEAALRVEVLLEEKLLPPDRAGLYQKAWSTFGRPNAKEAGE